MKPNLFIVGAPRCGTTFLAYHLNEHPEIFFLLSREPLYFAKDVSFFNSRITNLKEYESLFSKANQKWIGEKSPDYIYSNVAHLKIKEYSQNAKIIIMLRDPIDFICSWHHHNHNSMWGVKDNIADVNEAILAEKKRKEESGGEYRVYFYKEQANYYKYVKKYIEVFGKKNVKVILLEDIRDNPKETYIDILNFLNVKEYIPSFRVMNAGTPDQESFLIKTIFYIKRSSFRFLYTFLIYLFPVGFRCFVRDMFRTKTERSINPKLEREIRKELEPDIEKLEKLINRNLSSWKEMNKKEMVK